MNESGKLNLPEELPEMSATDTGGVTYEDRHWLDCAITKAGGKIVGGGFGLGGADSDYELDGHVFNVQLKRLK